VVDAGASGRTVWALRRAFHAVEAAKEARLKDVGITGAHYAVLINLGVAPGITGAEVARRLRVTPQNIASLVAKLEDRGWVARREHERHSHVRELHLTESGRRVLDAADREVTELEGTLREVLGDDATVLRDLLERVAALRPQA
jgi:DNA-binding MarR family transcriptional regulator